MLFYYKKNKIFNPTGDDTIANRTIIKGNVTGLFNLGDVKYNWAKQMYQVMIGNFWVPEKVSGLTDDATVYKQQLSPAEQRAYRGIISFLTFFKFPPMLKSITVSAPYFSEIFNFLNSFLILG